MFKNLKIITCALLAALSLAACGEPKETPEEAAVRALDCDALTHQVVAEITNTTNFPMAKDAAVYLKNDKLLLVLVVDDLTDEQTALDYADSFVRLFSLYANVADDTIKPAGTDYYGSLYDVYDLEIAVAPLSQSDNQDNWYIHDFVSAGMHTKQPIELLG